MLITGLRRPGAAPTSLAAARSYRAILCVNTLGDSQTRNVEGATGVTTSDALFVHHAQYGLRVALSIRPLSGSAGCSLLDDVVVDPSMRNRGIGHTLIAEMAAWMHEDGYTTIFGCATGGDGSAIHGGLFGWYERMGFEMTSPGGDMRADVPYLADRTSVFRAGENETHRP